MQSKSALEDEEKRQEAIEELQLIKKVQLNSAHGSTILSPVVASFQDERGLYNLFACKAVCTAQQMREAKPLDEPCVLFTLACVFSGIDALHEQQIVLRGVASWLIMINDVGYASIVELRYAAELAEPSYSLIGPPENIAPEQVRGSGHSFGVDYWALGVLGFEMAQGHHPFAKDGVDELKLARAITEHQYGALTFDESSPLSSGAQGLLQQLMHHDEDERIGGQQIMRHELFQHINWRQLGQGALRSPIAEHVGGILRGGPADKRSVKLPDFVQADPPSPGFFLKDW